MNYIVIKGDELYHHGIKGMKWGVRRYQNADGSLKAAGRKRYTEGGTDSAKTSKSGKQPLTDEERAARNKKIAKTVAVVAGTAVVAAGAYAAHKYLKNTMSEADSIMNDEKKKQMDRWMDSFLKQEEVSSNASARFEKAVNDYYHGPRTALRDEKKEREYMESAREFAEAARLDTTTLRNRMKTADRTMSSNIGNKKVRRAAQREIIKRDIKTAKLSAEIRRRKARNNPIDRVSQDWARAMISEPADSKIRSLAIRGESALKKRR